MKLKLFLLTIGLFLSFFISSTYAYQVPYYTYTSTGGAATLVLNQSSFRDSHGATCTEYINAKANFSSTVNFDTSWQYYSPLQTLIASGQRLGGASYSCLDLNTVNSTATYNNNYESKIILTETSTSGGFIKLGTRYVCSATSPTIELFMNKSDASMLDYGGNLPNGLVVETSGGTTDGVTDVSQYNVCSDVFKGKVFKPSHSGSCNSPTRCSASYIYPFNTSQAGTVSIYLNLTGAFSCSGGGTSNPKKFNVTLISADDASSIILYSIDNNCAVPQNTNNVIVSYSAPLGSNKLYYLVLNSRQFDNIFVSGMAYGVPQIVNITLDSREAQWSCGVWNDCLNGSKSRTCVDTLGNFEDRIELATCFPTAFEQQNIGFEQYNETGIYECKKDAWTCVSTPQSQTIKTPFGWTVGFATRNLSGNEIYVPKFIDMVLPVKDNNSIDAVDGTLALAMWYDPPSVDDVLQDTNTTIACGNQSVGRIPTIRKDLNQTVFTDITFPSPYSTLSWYARKFQYPVIQYQVWTPYCYPYNELCYAPNCTSSMLGSYKVGLYQLTNGSISNTVFEYFGNADSNWGQVILDMSNYNLQVGVTYRLVFAVIPPNTDTYRLDGVGLYFDSVVISNLPTAITQCQQFCNGTDLFVPRLSNGSCSFEVEINNTYCRNLVATGIIANQTATIFEPIGGNATNAYLDSVGAGFLAGFFSPFALSIFIFIAIGAVIEWKVRSGGVSFLSVLVTGVIVLTALGLMPIWAGILLAIISGYLLVHIVAKSFRGG